MHVNICTSVKVQQQQRSFSSSTFLTWFLMNAICCVWRVNTNCCLEINSRWKSLLTPLPGRERELLLGRTSWRVLQVLFSDALPLSSSEKAWRKYSTHTRLQTLKFWLLHQITVSVFITAVCIFVQFYQKVYRAKGRTYWFNMFSPALSLTEFLHV